MSIPFKENDLLLFIGDSITDCRRDKEVPDTLGMGYVSMIAGKLGLKYPKLNLRFINRGINGNRTRDLLERWDEDCIAHQPDWISIMIGVNNSWKRYTENDPTPDDRFEEELQAILERASNETEARLVVCSPFLMHISPEVERMREDLDPKITIIRELAERYNAIWIDFDAAFTAAEQRHIPSYWAEDGVHPSHAGHALMAETWCGVMGA